MFLNHLKIAFRALGRGKIYTILNITGLALGLACFGFISAWVLNELSYDRFHEKHDRIYRLTGEVKTDSETFDHAVTSPPMAAALQRDFPEVENAVRLDKNDCIVRRGDKQFLEDGVLFTDPSFFEIFSYRLTRGNAATALNDPYSLVLTESMARKYFGDENPLGQQMTLFVYDPGGQGAPYTVTGVLPDPPQNAHFTFNFLGSFNTMYAAMPEAATSEWLWFWNGYYTYLLLKPGTDPAQLQQKLPAFADRYLGEKM
ncbi:MAG: ABC transporter permease, partial [Calditrichaeota bacterium]|nr:ABC transporter permease [Calditrichota bacterium]